MRRLIPQKLIDWIKSIKGHVVQNGNKTEVGGDMEVDGVLSIKDIEGGTNGQVLTKVVDGASESVEWKEPPAGGTKLYKHNLEFTGGGIAGGLSFYLITTSATPIELADGIIGKKLIITGEVVNTPTNGGNYNYSFYSLAMNGPDANGVLQRFTLAKSSPESEPTLAIATFTFSGVTIDDVVTAL